MRRDKIPEAVVLAACLEYLEAGGIFAWRNGSGRARFGSGASARWVQFGIVGGADILGVLGDGRILAVETKSTSGRTTLAQDAFLDAIRGAGGVALVVRSLDDLIEGLEAAGLHLGELIE
jgi:hypothetical protein